MQKKTWKKTKRQRKRERNRGLVLLKLNLPLDMRRYLKFESQRLNISIDKIISKCLIEHMNNYNKENINVNS